MVKRRLIRAALALALSCAAGCATSRPREPQGPVTGYLPQDRIAHLAATGPASAEPALADEAIFGQVAPGTDRWWLATAHAELRPPWVAQHFDCVLSTRLTAAPRPALTRLMLRLSLDVRALAEAMAERSPAPVDRPFMSLAGLEPCVRLPEKVSAPGSWPSSAAVLSGAYGELLAKLAPDAAEPIRRTAREIGFSRVVCRMNWPAEVEAGLTTGMQLFQEAHRDPQLQTDLAAARIEVALARAEGLTSAACAAERLAVRQWSAPDPRDQARRESPPRAS